MQDHFDELIDLIPVRIMLNIHFHHHSSMCMCVCVLRVNVCVCVCVCEREEGSATIKLLPWKKVAVNSEIKLFIKYIR